MPIDVHAHYVPPKLLDGLEREGARYGVNVVEHQPTCQKCLRFEYGLQIRPFFPKLVEPVASRIESMQRTGIDRQVLSAWADIFGYALPAEKGEAWHRLLNDLLGEFSGENPKSFSWLASGPLPDAARAARELERAVKAGAVGGVLATHVEGTNLGELPLDEYWAAAVALDVPVFLHPAQPAPLPRTGKFALNQIVQYTFDTTLCVGSLISSGVLDRFPKLKLILSHGGGAVPYLAGRFDVMHERADKAQGIVAQAKPTTYLRRMWYDTVLHDAPALRYLAERVSVERIVLGSDDSFPPADRDPIASLKAAGFDSSEMKRITEDNPRQLFRL
ncbi:MAG TPA: amidohydrolase family protein [Burkholderiales bacterium]